MIINDVKRGSLCFSFFRANRRCDTHARLRLLPARRARPEQEQRDEGGADRSGWLNQNPTTLGGVLSIGARPDLSAGLGRFEAISRAQKRTREDPNESKCSGQAAAVVSSFLMTGHTFS